MNTVTSKDGMALTRTLLFCGVVAGPLYVVLGIFQMLIHPQFDPTRNDLSQMSIGPLGWVQVVNFLVSGLLVIAGAVGMRRVLRGQPGGTWGPLLIGIYGLGLVGAGFFSADPARGYPPGTPENAQIISGHGLLHFASGGIGFLALIAACFIFARRFSTLKQGNWTVYSAITGVLFLAAFIGIATGSSQNGPILVFVTLAFTVAVVIAWVWISVMAARLMNE